ncbi:MAG TPA: hypothetical protein VHU41_01010 [Thermoanaerobaculia bacterium]|nr:hypothetical protein [Thermoanaerobaculia bacterium]
MRVLAIGFFVLGIGTVALYFAFRSFGELGERTAGTKGFRMLLAAIAVIIVFCIVLLRLSVVRQ